MYILLCMFNRKGHFVRSGANVSTFFFVDFEEKTTSVRFNLVGLLFFSCFTEQMVNIIAWLWPCLRIFVSSAWICIHEPSPGSLFSAIRYQFYSHLHKEGFTDHFQLPPSSICPRSLLIQLPCHLFFVELGIVQDGMYVCFFSAFLPHYNMDSTGAVMLSHPVQNLLV